MCGYKPPGIMPHPFGMLAREMSGHLPGVKTSVYIPRDLFDRWKGTSYSHTAIFAAGLAALASPADEPVTRAVLRAELAAILAHLAARDREPARGPAPWPPARGKPAGPRAPYRPPPARRDGSGGRRSPEPRSVPAIAFRPPAP